MAGSENTATLRPGRSMATCGPTAARAPGPTRMRYERDARLTAISSMRAGYQLFRYSRYAWWLRWIMAPARSAWPGLGRVTVLALAPGGGTPTAMAPFQFSQSRFWIVRLIGLPSVTPKRTPEEMWT